MSRAKTITYLVGIAYCGDSLILLPKPGGFDLPSFQKKGRLKKCLLESLGQLGFEGVSITARLEPSEKEGDGTKVRYLPIVFAFEKMTQPFKTLPLDSKPEDAPELAKEYLWRCDVYAPMYQKLERTVPLLSPEQKRVDKEIKCLAYHERQIGKKTLDEFKALCASASSIRRINEAFVSICNTYRVNPNHLPEPTDGTKKKK